MICKDFQNFGRGFVRICETLGKDLQGFARDFGRGFARTFETLGDDSERFARLWERIHARICKDS